MATKDLNGIHHWADAGVASWYDFAVAIQDEALERKLLVRPSVLRPIRTDEYPTAARRPAYSVLDSRSAANCVGTSPRHWRHNLGQMLDRLASRAVRKAPRTQLRARPWRADCMRHRLQRRCGGGRHRVRIRPAGQIVPTSLICLKL
jgi:hypothetical protein